MLIVMLIVGLGFLALVGFTSDLVNFFLHRELTQNAANAACAAGAMDMLAQAAGQTLTNFTPGTNFSCTTSSTSSPCKYAKLNGFAGGGLVTGAASNGVDVSFPAATGCPGGSGCPAPGVTPPSALAAPYPFIRVDIVDRLSAGFTGFVTGARTVDIRSYSVCGMIPQMSAAPFVVLAPKGSSTLSMSGTPSITIKGGGPRSMQVNSTSSTAASITSIDFTHGGPNFSGSDFGLSGGPYTAPGGFVTAGSGAWRPASAPMPDPYALTATPSQPAAAAVPSDLTGSCTKIPCNIAYHNANHGCPDTGGCLLYTAGYYSSGITVKNATAVFDPGLYYLNGGLALQSNSLVRPGTGTGDGSGGTVFYLTGSAPKCSGQTGLVCVGSNSGSSSVDAFTTANAVCPGGAATDSRIGLPTTMSGNILLAPCSGTYGDPSGAGKHRGILFFQDRSSSSGGGWGGGGSFLLVGSMYFHHCNSSGTGTGCSSTAWDSSFDLQGNSGSGSFILGGIVTDTVSMGGTPSITMSLDPDPVNSIIKVTLFF